MTNNLVWFALICSVLGTGATAWTSSGVGRMHHLDARELRRWQHLGHILSRHAEATRPPRTDMSGAAPEPVGAAACKGCGARGGGDADQAQAANDDGVPAAGRA
ncbi:hypothetical protein [Streptomyces sp. NPDC093225]|uniref:hypothetical protein n=1 Tax=Streptomyces sp. NPDC093225 TaxID=3366034 RepID=UPI00381E25CE